MIWQETKIYSRLPVIITILVGIRKNRYIHIVNIPSVTSYYLMIAGISENCILCSMSDFLHRGILLLILISVVMIAKAAKYVLHKHLFIVQIS